jgi:hypothetical protein
MGTRGSAKTSSPRVISLLGGTLVLEKIHISFRVAEINGHRHSFGTHFLFISWPDEGEFLGKTCKNGMFTPRYPARE